MNRKMILLNLVLLALVTGLVWSLRVRWLEVQARVRTLREQPAQARPVIVPPAPLPGKPVMPAQYFEVADKTLFSRDRNPSVVVEPPPPPPPPPPMPELPSYHGEMSLGEPVVLLSTAKISQRSYHAGDTIGEFKVLRFDQEKITFEFQGKPVERALSELRAKENSASGNTQLANGVVNASPMSPSAPPAVAANAPSAFTPAKATVTTLGGVVSATGDKSEPANLDSMLGPELSGGERACVEGDNTPTGTVHSGYRKVSLMSLLGPLCHWEPTK